MKAVTVVLAVLVSLMIFAFLFGRECMSDGPVYATKRAKAQAIVDWFNARESPSYIAYRKDLAGASNVVEYYRVSELWKPGQLLSIDKVEMII